MRLFMLTALTMLAFAANSVLNRMAVGQGLISPVDFAVIRLLSGAAVLAVLAMPWRKPASASGMVRASGVFGLLIYLFGFSLAYQNLDAGTGALVLFGMVQVTMFAGALMTGETIPRTRWAGAALALAGVGVLTAPGEASLPLVPVLLMASAGAGWGAYSLAGRKERDPMLGTARNFLFAMPFALTVLALSKTTLPDGPGILLAVLSGAITSALGYALWYAILPRLGAARAAVAQLTVPILAAAGGAALLAEAPGWRFALACFLVLGGVVLASRQRVFPNR